MQSFTNNNSPMDWALNETEKDLFREIANIGLSKAADALAMLTKEKVLINVPDIQLVGQSKLTQLIADDSTEKAIIIQSEIRGKITGSTLLLFSSKHIENFVEDLIKDLGEFDSGDKRHIKESLLLEIGNIISGSIITQLANIFNLNIYGSVPRGPYYNVSTTVQDVLKKFSSFQPLIFTIKTKFLNSGTLLELPFIVVFDTDTLLKLLSIIRTSPQFSFLWGKTKV